MHGIHPDVVFRQDAPTHPYVTAMRKLRDAHPTPARPRELRALALANPDAYGLTREELAAVKAVSGN